MMQTNRAQSDRWFSHEDFFSEQAAAEAAILSRLCERAIASYLDDQRLSGSERSLLAEYLTLRVAIDGRLVWPISELDGAA